jgi:hypothetical protein
MGRREPSDAPVHRADSQWRQCGAPGLDRVRPTGGFRSVAGGRSSAATREKTASFAIACRAQGPTLGLQDDTEGHSFIARFASTPSTAHAPGLNSKPPPAEQVGHLPGLGSENRAWKPCSSAGAVSLQQACFCTRVQKRQLTAVLRKMSCMITGPSSDDRLSCGVKALSNRSSCAMASWRISLSSRPSGRNVAAPGRYNASWPLGRVLLPQLG